MPLDIFKNVIFYTEFAMFFESSSGTHKLHTLAAEKRVKSIISRDLNRPTGRMALSWSRVATLWLIVRLGI